MSNFRDVFSQLVLKNEHVIKNICNPLSDCLDVPLFCYARVGPNGQFVNLANRPEALEPYYMLDLFREDPLIVHPEFLDAGLVFIPTDYNPEYMQKLFKKSSVKSILLILKKSGACSEAFFFGTKINQQISLLSCLDLLYSFTGYFKQAADTVIERVWSEQVNVNLIEANNFFKVPVFPLVKKNSKIEQFADLICPLSKLERRCLELFKAGKTHQAIGATLGLSDDAVEFYFDKIKNKLGCTTEMDLLLS